MFEEQNWISFVAVHKDGAAAKESIRNYIDKNIQTEVST